MKRTRCFMFFSILFQRTNVKFFKPTFKFVKRSCTICMNIYENIQHYMDIYDEIFILWHPIFLNLSIHWHKDFRYSIELFLMCHYYIKRSFVRSFTFFIILRRTRSSTFFIPISHIRYIYRQLYSLKSWSIHPKVVVLLFSKFCIKNTSTGIQFLLTFNSQLPLLSSHFTP